MLNYEPSYHDQTLDPLIQQILPDIQQSLKKQLMADLQKEAQAQFQKEFAKVQQQAIEEYELALHDLEEEGNKIFKEQTEHLIKQIEKLQKDRKNREQVHLKHLEDRYISENFQSLILIHPKIQEIQSKLALQILRNSEQKMEAAKQRRIREIAVKMQNKQQKAKVQREKAIKNQIYQSRSLDELRKDIQIMKIGIASMKSEYNIKIKKIDEEIKQVRVKNKTIQPKLKIQDLRKQFQIVQTRNQEIAGKEINDLGENNTILKQNDTFSHLHSSAQLILDPIICAQPWQKEGDFANDDRHNSSSSSSSGDFEENYDDRSVPSPPPYSPSQEVSQQNIKTFENHVPILQLNVAALLRSNWEDPLQKYVNKFKGEREFQSSSNPLIELNNNQNDGKIGNKPSFQQIYHQHLQKLNQATKTRKLSVQAKKTILRNLGMMRARA